jgi:hypothetical protein
MVFGTVEDLQALRGLVNKNDYREALEQAPPGIFDERSWAYWNLIRNRHPSPPLPVRAGLYPIRRPHKSASCSACEKQRSCLVIRLSMTKRSVRCATCKRLPAVRRIA